jgi:hypothetical protein
MVASLHMMVVAEEKGTDGNPHLEQVAAAHSKESRDIPPHLYDEWLRCLLLAAAKFDPHWDEQSEAVWRKMMEKGIRYMTARYEGPSA